MCRPNPHCPLFRGLQDDVLVQNVGYHTWNGDIVGPWKNNFYNFDIIVTAKTIGNAEVILDKNIRPFWALNEGTPIVMNVEWVIMMMILMILNIDRGIDKKIMIDH